MLGLGRRCNSRLGNATTMAAPTKIFGGVYGDDVDDSRWVVIYPPYIDSTRKISDGRKIAVDKCVSKPNAMEIFECAKQTGLKTCIELDKAYCRDYWVRGRIRVCLFDQLGKPLNTDIPNSTCALACIPAL